MPTMGCTSFVSTEFRPSAGAVVAALPGLLLASGAALEDDVYIMSHGITHAIILTPTMPTMSPAVSYSHIVPDLSTHASALALLHRACDTIDAALLVQSGAVLVVSSRAPAFGGVAGAAGAAYLVRSGRCASLAEAIDRCCNPQKLKGNTLAALCALELEVRPPTAATASTYLPPELATCWELPMPPPTPPTETFSMEADVGAPECMAFACGAAMSLRTVSQDPQLCLVSNFVSLEEAAHLRGLAQGRLAPSRIARTEDALNALLAVASSVGGDADDVAMPGAEAAAVAAIAASKPATAAWRTSTSCSIGGGAIDRAKRGGSGDVAKHATQERGRSLERQSLEDAPVGMSGAFASALAEALEQALEEAQNDRHEASAEVEALQGESESKEDTAKAAEPMADADAAEEVRGMESMEEVDIVEGDDAADDGQKGMEGVEGEEGEEEEEDEEEDEIVARVVNRAAFLSGLSPLHAEGVQVVSYAPGQQYREHTDYFSPTQDQMYDERTASGGNRLVSVFCCLASADAGGATTFPKLQRSFQLQPGDALLWMNIDRSGKLDSRTLHAGRPVEAGMKVGMNVWLRQRPLVLPSAVAGGGESGSATGRAWKPVRPPPRQTAANPAAQSSTDRNERIA